MKKFFLFLLVCVVYKGYGQEFISLTSLDFFKPSSGDWSISGDVNADLDKKNILLLEPGTGILVCEHINGKYGMEYDLFSKTEYGDMDVELDFLLAKQANSGIYFQGRYELQLMDSWGVKNPRFGDCGGIYQRWDESKPEGMKGFEGTAPRINAAKAPGLWQHLFVSFQAPRFDAAGKKISNAKFLKVVLNGQIIHENVELTGPTRGPIAEDEVAKAAFRIQGDHGSIAFRNIKIKSFEGTPAAVSNLTYQAHYENYDPNKDAFSFPFTQEGSLGQEFTWEFLTSKNPYTFIISGEFTAPKTGEYTFSQFMSCSNSLSINGKLVLDYSYTGPNTPRKGTVSLNAGKHTIEIRNAHFDAWMPTTLGLYVEGPGFREVPLHSMGSFLGFKQTDPILVDRKTQPILRSFMDLKKTGKRVVHAVNVGSESGLHYTYDMDHAAICQIWRGGFLDATPMWNDRGDGSSRPLGAVTELGADLLWSKSSAGTWPKDTASSSFKPKGYSVNANNEPTFHYQIHGMDVQDKITVIEDKYFQRELRIKDNSGMYARLASGSKITKIKDGLYAFEDKSFMLSLDTESSVIIRRQDELEELIVPVKSDVFTYSILF